jgi:hypothetical protein
MDIAERVQTGIEALDEHFGDSSWAKKIDLDTFAFESTDNCVLGQLFGDYMEAPDRVREGFKGELEWSFSWHSAHPEHAMLMHDEWNARIEELQSK